MHGTVGTAPFPYNGFEVVLKKNFISSPMYAVVLLSAHNRMAWSHDLDP